MRALSTPHPIAMAAAPRTYYLAVLFALGLGLAWVGWRVTALSLQVGELQARVEALSDELQQADDTLAQSQEAMQRVRDATDGLSAAVDALDGRALGEVLPALLQARQALQEAVTDAEDAVGAGPDPQEDDAPAQPALET
jgi:hypothetical protein